MLVSRLNNTHMMIFAVHLPMHRVLFGAANRSKASPLRVLSSTTPPGPPQPDHLLTSLLSGWLSPYWEMTPSSEASLEAIEEHLPEAQIAFDHLAFRTFGVEHLGIASLSRWFQDCGYTEQPEELRFEAKKLRARWLSPPLPELPRIFISELCVAELSAAARVRNLVRCCCGGR